MSERTSSKPGIADYVVARRKRKECFLDEIDRLIDWNTLEKLLRKTLKRVVNAVGNPAYPPLPMFKILLLQRWYNLSDTAVEEALYDRLSFVRFVGLSRAERKCTGWPEQKCTTRCQRKGPRGPFCRFDISVLYLGECSGFCPLSSRDGL